MKKSIFLVFLRLELLSIRTRVKSTTSSGWCFTVHCFCSSLLAGFLLELFETAHCKELRCLVCV